MFPLSPCLSLWLTLSALSPVSRLGRLSTKETRTVCKAFHLPLADDLLLALFNKYTFTLLQTMTLDLDHGLFSVCGPPGGALTRLCLPPRVQV